jgi:hypothetical protein
MRTDPVNWSHIAGRAGHCNVRRKQRLRSTCWCVPLILTGSSVSRLASLPLASLNAFSAHRRPIVPLWLGVRKHTSQPRPRCPWVLAAADLLSHASSAEYHPPPRRRQVKFNGAPASRHQFYLTRCRARCTRGPAYSAATQPRRCRHQGPPDYSVPLQYPLASLVGPTRCAHHRADPKQGSITLSGCPYIKRVALHIVNFLERASP